MGRHLVSCRLHPPLQTHLHSLLQTLRPLPHPHFRLIPLLPLQQRIPTSISGDDTSDYYNGTYTDQSLENITNFNGTFGTRQPYVPQQQARINWGDLCMNPLVDYVITEPCSTLTSPDGYTLTSEGQRVLMCLAGGALVGILAPDVLVQIRQLGPAVS